METQYPAVRRAAVAGVAILSLSILTACSPAGAASETDELYIAVQDDPVCLDPQQVTLTTALNIGRQIVDSLVDQDPETGEIVPWLAESFDSNEDLTEFTFELRDDVTFSDGSMLTAETVQKNFDALAALGSAASLASQYLAGYAGSTVVDEHTVTVSFTESNAQFLQGASTITLGLLANEVTMLSAEERCQAPVGSGPFELESYTSNDAVVLTAREGYGWASQLRAHAGDASVGRVVFAVTPEPGVRAGGLQTGEFDMILDLPAADEARFETDDFRIYARANPGVPHSLVPNTERPIVSDAAVRQAMLLATDRHEISELTGSSKVPAASGALSSATPDYIDLSGSVSTNLDAAEKLLDAAGWEAGPSGVRQKDGIALTMSVKAFYGQDVLEATQAQLARTGIDLQIEMVTAGDFFGAVASQDYDFLGAGLTRTDPDVLRVMFSTDSVARWGIVANPELEVLLAKQAGTPDVVARAGLLRSAQTMIIEEAYLIPLLEVAQVHASQNGIEGVAFDSSSRIILYDAAFAS